MSYGLMDTVVKKVRKGYADSNPQKPLFKYSSQRQGGWYGEDPYEVRDLSFLAAPVPASQSYEAAKFIGGYNEFRPKTATDKLVKADPMAHVQIGREGSVVFYIRPSAPAGAQRLYDAFKEYGDEVGFVDSAPSKSVGEKAFKPGMFLRVWWD